MEYFRMSQEKTMLDAVQPTGTSNQTWREPFQRLNPRQFDDQPLQFYIKEQAHPQYIDFIEHPLPLVTDKVKSLLEKYQPNSFFKPVILADLRRMRVFSIKGIMENYIIVRLDVAESLLRRDAAGITFTKATCV
jgi:hypothetical protein